MPLSQPGFMGPLLFPFMRFNRRFAINDKTSVKVSPRNSTARAVHIARDRGGRSCRLC